MPHEIAAWIVAVALVYGALGILFAVPFVLRGIERVDPAAKDGTVGFRILVLPGAALLWPLLLRRWVRGTAAPPEERGPHRPAGGGGA